MNQYTVIWDPDVEGPFIDAWAAGDSTMRQILTEAANWVDAHLAVSPESQGQSRLEQAARVLAVPVSDLSKRVSVTYRVFPEDFQVRIICLIIRDQ